MLIPEYIPDVHFFTLLPIIMPVAIVLSSKTQPAHMSVRSESTFHRGPIYVQARLPLLDSPLLDVFIALHLPYWC